MISPSDIEIAVINHWAASNLDASFPGSIKSGRRVPPVAQPYAQVEAQLAAGPQFYTESGQGGGPYLATFDTAITLRGVGEKAIGDLVKTVATALDDQQWVVPGATFQAAWPVGLTLTEEPEKKQGEDIWQAQIRYEVQVSGTL